MARESRHRAFWILSLLSLLGVGTAALAPAASAAPAYSPPSGAWARFVSDLNAAQGLATGNGVTIALLSTGVDPDVIGGDRVTTGPDYIFKPRIAESQMAGTFLAAFLVGANGRQGGVAPGARILSLRTEPDPNEPGALSAAFDPEQAVAQGIRYAAGHGAQVIITDLDNVQQPSRDLVSAVSYAVSKNVVIVTAAFFFPRSPLFAASNYSYPQGFPGVIAVAPVMLPGGIPPTTKVSGQNNNSVLISAPTDAVPVSATLELDNFGTVMCFAAGTVAMIKHRYPDLSPALVARALAMSARYHPPGGYSTSAGFGVLDPYDAILDAGKLARLTTTAPAGASGAVAAGTHFGAPPGVTSALPPIGRVAYLYWAGIALGALLLIGDLVLVARRRRRARHPGSPRFVPQPPPQYPAPQYPAAQYPAVPNPAPPYPTRPNYSPWSAAQPTRPQPALPAESAEPRRGWFDPR